MLGFPIFGIPPDGVFAPKGPVGNFLGYIGLL